MKKPFILLFLLVFTFLNSFSQSPEELEIIFPDDDAVAILRSELITIRDYSASLKITQHLYSKKMIINNDNPNHYWLDHIFYNSLSPAVNIKGSTLNSIFGDANKKAYIPEVESLMESTDLYADMSNQEVYFLDAKRGSNLVLEYDKNINGPLFFTPYSFVKKYSCLKSRLIIRCEPNIILGWNYHGPDSYSFEFTKKEIGGMVEYKWEMDTVASFDLEDNGPGFQELSPKIIFYIKTIIREDVPIPFLDSIASLHKWYRTLIKQTNYKSKQSINAIAHEITDTCHNEDEKIRAVFQWVQRNIKYINASVGLGGFIPDDCVDVLRNRYGDCKAMTNLTKEILNASGVESYYCWVGTNDLPYTYAENFTTSTDNHMILAVGSKENYKLLDATNSFGELYKAPYYIQGKEVLISLGPKDFIIHKVPLDSASANILLDKTYLYEEDGVLKGHADIKLTGSIKHTIEMDFPLKKDEVVDFIAENLKKATNKALLENIEYFGIKDRTDSMKISYDFSLSKYGQSVGDKKYLSLHFTVPFYNDEIDIAKRKFDYLFDIPFTDDYYMVYEIPEGYGISFMPPNRQINFDNYQFNLVYELVNNKLMMHRKIILKSRRIRKNEFENWNQFVSELKKAYREVIVLQRN